MDGQRRDAIVIGAGFGGLAAALRLAEQGARVTLVEALAYPGGCASTFSRGGRHFEAGATLFSGFAPGQLFRTWIDRYALDVTVDWLDPVVELRTPAFRFAVPRDRDRLADALCALPGAPVAAVRSFLAAQRRVADLLWELLDRPQLLPPLGAGAWRRHLGNLPRYLRLLPHAGRPLIDIARRHGVAGFAPLTTFLDALCQITLQCGIGEAEAPFALATMDYYARGTGHVRGGIGALARGLVQAIRDQGGEVVLANRVDRLRRTRDGWLVCARRGDLVARTVIANLLPQSVRGLLGAAPGEVPTLDRLAERVETGWGACMLYRAVRVPAETAPARHLQVVQDASSPLAEGNHLFCSLGGPRADGVRSLTCSTHVRIETLRSLAPEARGPYVAAIQARMREGLARFAPEWGDEVVVDLTASPRTFARFTGRPEGYVGGVPRRAGLHNYRDLRPRAALPGLYLAGDTLFPGQSTLATAIGGCKTAEFANSARSA